MPLLTLFFAVACDNSKSSDTTPTYYQDIKPILDAQCQSCHSPGGIGSISFDTYEDASAYSSTILDAIESGSMPPWAPSTTPQLDYDTGDPNSSTLYDPQFFEGCSNTDYQNARVLSETEKNTIRTWVENGTPEGTPSVDSDEESGDSFASDLTVAITDDSGEPTDGYHVTLAKTNVGDNDIYRCFPADWPSLSTQYITGFNAIPGDEAIVHHVIAFIAPPELAPIVEELDAADSDLGYYCPGGAGLGDEAIGDFMAVRPAGVWAPGETGKNYPENTGLEVEPESKVILQVHYSLSDDVDEIIDNTQAEFAVAQSIETPAHILPFTDPRWVNNLDDPLVEAGSEGTSSISYDLTRVADISDIFGFEWPLETGAAVTMWGIFPHMHQLGEKLTLFVDGNYSEDGTDWEPGQCLMDVEEWNFHWQGMYFLNEPAIFEGGKSLMLSCTWNNPTDSDVYWGEGTADEMCLAFLYLTGN